MKLAESAECRSLSSSNSKVDIKMFRRILPIIIALGLLVCFAAMAHADGYTLVNKTKYELWIQSKASKQGIYFPPSQIESFLIQKGQSKRVDFGSDFFLKFVWIQHSDEKSRILHHHNWDRYPDFFADPQHWTVTVKIKNNKMKVDKRSN